MESNPNQRMDTNKEAILEKIKKLLRMRRGGTPGEIENALAMAAKLAEPDSINQAVIEKLRARALRGQEKYGVGMDRDDLTTVQWLTHLQEELLDAAVYTEKLIQLQGAVEALEALTVLRAYGKHHFKQPYIVGDRRPELFVPDRTGSVAPPQPEQNWIMKLWRKFWDSLN